MTNNSVKPTWTFSPVQINSVSINDDGSRCVFGTSFERGTGNFATYLIDGMGNQIWKQEIASNETTQGVFWVDISGNGDFIASGGEYSKTQGFLKAYIAENGQVLLDITTNDRINQVSLSKDGQYLTACYGSTLNVYLFNQSLSMYEQIASESLAPYSVNSCVISRNGNTIVASGIQYGDNDTTTGKAFAFSISDNQVTSLGSCEIATGCMRVAIIDSGLFWAASLHDGSCMLFGYDNPSTCIWQYKPDNPNLMLAYAVDITLTDTNQLFVACGANLSENLSKSGDGGFLYLVETVLILETLIPNEQLIPVLKWSTPIKYGVNPGVSMDLNATYVSATDGKPDGQSVKESAGNFYLYSVKTGGLVWQYETTMMNWPMKLARNGTSVFAGSDNGNVYYWKLSDD